ncbi:hypothetical protein BJF90_34965 [Pseudonocardia sp. CNS-004]|nr:hypothetical protein BJF90_34965 [Pseudonocardia sp. CNS-004]
MRVAVQVGIERVRGPVSRAEPEVDVQPPAAVGAVRGGVYQPKSAVGRDERGQQAVDDRLQLWPVEAELDRHRDHACPLGQHELRIRTPPPQWRPADDHRSRPCGRGALPQTDRVDAQAGGRRPDGRAHTRPEEPRGGLVGAVGHGGPPLGHELEQQLQAPARPPQVKQLRGVVDELPPPVGREIAEWREPQPAQQVVGAVVAHGGGVDGRRHEGQPLVEAVEHHLVRGQDPAQLRGRMLVVAENGGQVVQIGHVGVANAQRDQLGRSAARRCVQRYADPQRGLRHPFQQRREPLDVT